MQLKGELNDDRKELNVWMEVFHSTSKNPPDFVKSITITAPNGTVITMDTVNNWLPYDRGYWASYPPELFLPAGEIPSGEYTVGVEGYDFDLFSIHRMASVSLIFPRYKDCFS